MFLFSFSEHVLLYVLKVKKKTENVQFLNKKKKNNEICLVQSWRNACLFVCDLIVPCFSRMPG